MTKRREDMLREGDGDWRGKGGYVDHVQANGAVVRVWQPGHYE